MAKVNLDIIVAAVDRATSPLTKVSHGLSQVGKAAKGVAAGFEGLTAAGQKIRNIGMVVAAVGLAITATFGAAAHAASEFNLSMAEVSTLVDTAVVDMQRLKRGVLEVAMATGQKAKDSAESLYQSLSGGIEPAKAVEFIGVAAKTATAGVTDMATATDALTTVLNAYGLGAEDAARVSGVLLSVVQQGKTRLTDLAQSLGQVVPIASAAGVAMEEMAGGIASMTSQGLDAAQAITAQRAAISTILSPTERAVEMAQMLGIEFSRTKMESMGLARFLQYVRTAAEGAANAEGVLAAQEAVHKKAIEAMADAAQRTADVVERAARAQETATERVTDAQKNLADSTRDLEELQTSLAERMAEQTQTATERLADAQESAADRIKSALERVQDAQEALAEADSPREQAHAWEKLQEAQEDYAQTVTRSERDLTRLRRDTTRDQQKTQKNAARTLRDAQERIGEAQTAAARASDDAAQTQVTAAKEIGEAQAEEAKTAETAKAEETDAIATLERQTKDAASVMSTFFENVRGLNYALGTTGQNFERTLSKIAAAEESSDLLETMSGKVEKTGSHIGKRLKEILGTIWKDAGDAVGPYIEKIKAGLIPVLLMLEKFAASPAGQAVLTMVAAFGLLLAIVGPIIAAFGSLLMGIGGVGAAVVFVVGAMQVLAPYVGIMVLIAAGLAAVGAAAIAAGAAIWKYWGPIKEWFIALWAEIKGPVLAAWAAIKQAAIDVWGALKEAVGDVGGGFGSFIKLLLESLIPAIVGVVKWVAWGIQVFAEWCSRNKELIALGAKVALTVGAIVAGIVALAGVVIGTGVFVVLAALVAALAAAFDFLLFPLEQVAKLLGLVDRKGRSAADTTADLGAKAKQALQGAQAAVASMPTQTAAGALANPLAQGAAAATAAGGAGSYAEVHHVFHVASDAETARILGRSPEMREAMESVVANANRRAAYSPAY